MGAPNAKDITKVGHDVLSTAQSQTTGLVTAQTGDVVTSEPSANDSEWYFPPGLVARPRKADPGKKAAQVAAITRSDNDAIVGCRDDRNTPAVDEGETALFASVDGGAVLKLDKSGGATLTSGDIKMGDDDAATLADGSALNTVIQLLQGIAATWVALTPPSTPITAGALNAYGQTIQQALNAVSKIQTTKVKAT